MIVDGHGHACGPYLTNESINKYLEENKTDYVILTAGQKNSTKIYKMKDKTILSPDKDFMNGNNKLINLITRITNAQKYVKAGNEYVYELKLRNKRVRQYYWVTQETIEEIDVIYQKMKFDGIKIHQVWKYISANSKLFDELAMWSVQHDMPLFVHLNRYEDAKLLSSYMKQNPVVKIIVAHLYGYEVISETSTLMNENLFFDISNNYFVSKKRIESILKKVGSNRIVMGSDTPYGKDSLSLTINRVESLPITADEKDAILGNTLAKLIHI